MGLKVSGHTESSNLVHCSKGVAIYKNKIPKARDK